MYLFPSSADQTLYDTILAGEHWFECKVAIDGGLEYEQDKIRELSTQYRVFSEEQPGVGGCLSAEINLALEAPSNEIPRMARISVYVRAVGYISGVVTYSAWMPQGVFWVDTRETSKNDDGLSVTTIHGYDTMLKAEADYPDTTHSWPMPDMDVVEEIAGALGIGVDDRTWSVMSHGYQIYAPVGYSLREVLGNIASMYAGNWVCNYNGDLLLVAINGIPMETNYLVDNSGFAITFGGDKILV